ncbi:MAG TPA: MEDS domain-containing protein [Polyangia bacterium]
MDLSTAKLGALRASGHLCFPYESEDEKRTTLVAFVRDGLARRERCVYIGTLADQSELLRSLEAAGVRVARALERGALVLKTQAETYLRSGRFDPDDAVRVLEELVETALADGYAGLRGTGEASAPVSDELWPLVLRYESLVNERLGRSPFLGMCRLPAWHDRPGRAQDLLRMHPHALLRGEVCANPFYERPEIVLSDDAHARLDWQLHQLRSMHRARRRLERRSADRLLSTLADELADPLFALKREVHALGAALDETAVPERLEAAHHQLRRLTEAVEAVRDAARLSDRDGSVDGRANGGAAPPAESEARDEPPRPLRR